MKRVFADFHHLSLLRSLVMLFEERLGYKLYRPVGMDWWEQHYWCVSDTTDSSLLMNTALQYLSFSQRLTLVEGDVRHDVKAQVNVFDPLNPVGEDGEFYFMTPGDNWISRACTLDYFKRNKFDILIATVPQHIPLFQKLIEDFQPEAKLIFQVGNQWEFDRPGLNVLASVRPKPVQHANAIFYHQEFPLDVFTYTPPEPTKKIYSFVNCLARDAGEADFRALEKSAPDYEFKSYGHVCRDGFIAGDIALAEKMREAQVFFHVKRPLDGFGHVIHNAYAMGRPVIGRRQYSMSGLAGELLISPDTFLDLDSVTRSHVMAVIDEWTRDPIALRQVGDVVHQRFVDAVNFDEDAERVRVWLEDLR